MLLNFHIWLPYLNTLFLYLIFLCNWLAWILLYCLCILAAETSMSLCELLDNIWSKAGLFSPLWKCLEFLSFFSASDQLFVLGVLFGSHFIRPQRVKWSVFWYSFYSNNTFYFIYSGGNQPSKSQTECTTGTIAESTDSCSDCSVGSWCFASSHCIGLLCSRCQTFLRFWRRWHGFWRYNLVTTRNKQIVQWSFQAWIGGWPLETDCSGEWFLFYPAPSLSPPNYCFHFIWWIF